MNKRYDSPYLYLINRLLEFAIFSYEDRTSILTVLRTEGEEVRELFYLLEYNSENSKIAKERRILLEKYITEENIINTHLRYPYGNIEKMAKNGLDGLLEYVRIYRSPNPKIFISQSINPFVKILTINPKSYTMYILSTPYILLLLAIYYHILSCRMNEKCKNYYPTPNGIKELIKIKYTYSKVLEKHRLIERVLYSRPKYILTEYGEEVSKHLSLQAYIAHYLI